MTAKTLIEEAKDIVVNAAGFDNPETLEAGIPLMIWMHRNNVERKGYGHIVETGQGAEKP
jgi:hypothetical protein